MVVPGLAGSLECVKKSELGVVVAPSGRLVPVAALPGATFGPGSASPETLPGRPRDKQLWTAPFGCRPVGEPAAPGRTRLPGTSIMWSSGRPALRLAGKPRKIGASMWHAASSMSIGPFAAAVLCCAACRTGGGRGDLEPHRRRGRIFDRRDRPGRARSPAGPRQQPHLVSVRQRTPRVSGAASRPRPIGSIPAQLAIALVDRRGRIAALDVLAPGQGLSAPRSCRPSIGAERTRKRPS